MIREKNMTRRDFCYWLQGFFELSENEQLSKSQTESVKKHLSLVFKHEIDPSMGPKEHQDILSGIHNY